MAACKNKTPIEISDIVLSERWDLKKRKELYQNIRGIEYDGELWLGIYIHINIVFICNYTIL